ncbi:unnamed protein product [Trichobilharzia szidati]|nr:unnamed protein product [Trichobilharzia szidati]
MRYNKSKVRINFKRGNHHVVDKSNKNRKKFKPKYDSRVRLVKQRIIQKQRAQFTFQNSNQKNTISNNEEVSQPEKIISIPKPIHKLSNETIEHKETISPVELDTNRPLKKVKVIGPKKSKSSQSNENQQQPQLKEKPTKSKSNLYSSDNSKEVWFDDVPSALIANSMHDQAATSQSLVKSTSFTGPTRRIAMDCEFVGVGYEGADDALARVSIVNQFGHVLLDTYVRPEERVVDYRTKFSGIRPRDLRKNGPARPFLEVHKEVAELIKNRVLIGHSILKDLHVLRLSHPRRFIRDTSRYRPFRDLFSGRIPSLKALTQKVLGVTVQDGEHDSVEDARATMRLYTSVKRVWESSKKNRTVTTNKKFKQVVNLEEQGQLDVIDEYKSGLTEDKPKLNSQQSNKSGRNKNPTRWDPLRGRKCSKKRLKFLSKRRKQQKHK